MALGPTPGRDRGVETGVPQSAAAGTGADGATPVLLHSQAVPDAAASLLASGQSGVPFNETASLGLTRTSDIVDSSVQGGLLGPIASPVLSRVLQLSGGTRAAVSSPDSATPADDVFELLGYTRYRVGPGRLRTSLRGSMRLQQGGFRDSECGLRLEIGYSPEIRAVLPSDLNQADASSGSSADDDVITGGGGGSSGSSSRGGDSVKEGDLPPLVRRFRVLCDDCGAGPSAPTSASTPRGGRVLAEVDVPIGLAAQVRLHPLPLIPTMELRFEVAAWSDSGTSSLMQRIELLRESSNSGDMLALHP